MDPRRPHGRLARALLAFGLGALSACVGPDTDEASPGPIENDTPARVWRQNAVISRCRTWSIAENFSSGRFNVHRYRLSLPAGVPVSIQLARTAGSWQPALVAYDVTGKLLYLGGTAFPHANVVAHPGETGREGASAAVALELQSPASIDLYVTGWAAVDSTYEAALPRDAKYTLTAGQSCDLHAGWQPVYGGLEQRGSSIPRRGLANPTLRATLGLAEEPLGETVVVAGKSVVEGTVSWFGGPEDTGDSAYGNGAITGERVSELNDPVDPPAEVLAERPADYYFAAMRFSYRPNGIAFWAGARLLVVNPETGAAIVVRPVDWGPHTSTGRIIDLSPQSLTDLGIVTDDRVWIAFAAADTPLGRVEE